MSTMTVAAVRQRVAAVIEALTDPAAWHESRWTYDLFPADPGHFAHLSFAVGVPRTPFAERLESVRHKRPAGGLVDSALGVRWTYRIRGDAQVADYDLALAAEQILLKALTGTPRSAASGPMHLYVLSLSRRIVGDGTWLLGEVPLEVTHRLALE